MNIAADERIFVAGKTGSGKTYLAAALTASLPRLVVVDLKGTFAAPGIRPPSRELWRALARGRPCRVAVREPETALEWMAHAYQSGGTAIYVDEVYALVPPGSRPPEVVTAIWTRGREYQVSGWAATQRPTWVPLALLSESDHFFCFRLLLAEDRKRMSAFMGRAVETAPRDPHGFWHMRADGESARYYARLQALDLDQEERNATGHGGRQTVHP